MLGCWNFVEALGLNRGVVRASPVASIGVPPRVCDWGCSWEDDATVPINQAVLDTWDKSGIVRREINCGAPHARPLPPVDPTLGPASVQSPSDEAKLYKVTYRFEGITSPDVLDPISNGKGYAIDCGANQELIKAARALPPTRASPFCSNTDPILRGLEAGRPAAHQVHESGLEDLDRMLETGPRTDFFRFGASKSLFQFTCEPTRAFFADGITDVLSIPEQSASYLFVNPKPDQDRTDIQRVGCGAHDECADRTASCAAGTRCVDRYIGFACEACPAGYTSDGYTCRDIDECTSATATCAAGTYCVNDPATYHCESCATGFTSDHPSELADVNGDGKADFVGFGRDGVVVALAEDGTFGDPRIWVKSYGEAVGSWTEAKYPRTTADVNGDGKADIVGFGSPGVYVSISNGTSFHAPELWVASFGLNAGGWTVGKHPRLMADVNGDHKADVVGFADDGVHVSLSTGTGFLAPRRWVADFGMTAGTWSSDKHPRMMADVDGDGKSDVVGFGNAGVYVSRSTGTTFTAPTLWVNAYGATAGGWDVDRHPRMMADVDGDHRADVVGFADTGVFVSLARSGSFTAPTMWVASYGVTAGGWLVDKHPRSMVDVDGDGKADVVGFGNLGGFVSLARAGHFTAPALWARGYEFEPRRRELDRRPEPAPPGRHRRRPPGRHRRRGEPRPRRRALDRRWIHAAVGDVRTLHVCCM